jgi:hypothetical protein
MSGLGWHNPFPLEFGGGETAVERIYYALRSNVGKGGSADDDEGSLDGLWRQSRARGIASVATFGERSALQAFPDRATDLLPYYEQLFLLTNDPATSDHERREAAAVRYTQQIASAIPDIGIALRLIDPRFEVLTTSPDQSDSTLFGRAFEDYAAAEPFGGGRKSTAFPNYSSEFVAYVLLDLGGGIPPTTSERRSMDAAAALLNEVLPAHNSFQIVTHRGFTLDVDLLDLTSFGA